MKILLISTFIWLTVISLSFSQSAKHIELIQDFVQVCLQQDSLIAEHLAKKNIINSNDNGLTPDEAFERKNTMNTILSKMSDSLKSCRNNNKKFEILKFEESKKTYKLDEDLIVPEEGHAYVLFCDGKVMGRFLIVGNQIEAFCVFDKGRRKYFLSL